MGYVFLSNYVAHYLSIIRTLTFNTSFRIPPDPSRSFSTVPDHLCSAIQLSFFARSLLLTLRPVVHQSPLYGFSPGSQLAAPNIASSVCESISKGA